MPVGYQFITLINTVNNDIYYILQLVGSLCLTSRMPATAVVLTSCSTSCQTLVPES